MGRSALPTAFTDTELDALHGIYHAACEELGITPSEEDALRRDALANAIIQIAKSGETDTAVIQSRAVAQFRAPR